MTGARTHYHCTYAPPSFEKLQGVFTETFPVSGNPSLTKSKKKTNSSSLSVCTKNDDNV